MPVKLYLMRHGETEWSLSGQHTGVTDIPLTANGEEEARRLAPQLTGIHFSAALCSPRQRAMRTGELAGLGALVQVEPGLAEWDYGDYEGIRTPEILKERPGGTSLLMDARMANCPTRCRHGQIGSSRSSRRLRATWP